VQDYEPEPSFYYKKNGGSYEIMKHIPDVGKNGITVRIGETPYKPHNVWEDENGNVMAQMKVKKNGNGGCCVPERVMKKILEDPRFEFSTMSVDTKKEDLVQITLRF
jgi:hypothetical protein